LFLLAAFSMILGFGFSDFHKPYLDILGFILILVSILLIYTSFRMAFDLSNYYYTSHPTIVVSNISGFIIDQKLSMFAV
jgi:hypothetical protein